MIIQGEFRVRLASAAKMQELEQAYAKDLQGLEATARRELYEELLTGAEELDTGWSKNVVTDFGRRRLLNSGWSTGAFSLFIAESTAPSNVRRTMTQFVYASASPAQYASPTTATNDADLLLQTRSVTFTAPAVTRTINMVGLTGGGVTVNHLYGIVAYTKLSTPVVQDTMQVADVQYRVTWSL